MDVQTLSSIEKINWISLDFIMFLLNKIYFCNNILTFLKLAFKIEFRWPYQESNQEKYQDSTHFEHNVDKQTFFPVHYYWTKLQLCTRKIIHSINLSLNGTIQTDNRQWSIEFEQLPITKAISSRWNNLGVALLECHF